MLKTAISVASWGSNRLDVFALGTDNSMYHKAWDGAWRPSQTDWEPLGGVFNSRPAVASWGPNRLDIFGLGTDNRMYHKAWDGAWRPSQTDWESLGGEFDPAPSPVSMPIQFDWEQEIRFNGPVPVGGVTHLTIRKDGSYVFSGALRDSGATEYNLNLVWAIKDARNQAYKFEHSGHVSGTFEPGSRDDHWSMEGTNEAIAQNWQYLVIDNKASVEASANLDLVNLGNAVIGALGLVLGVVGIVISGQSPKPPQQPGGDGSVSGV